VQQRRGNTNLNTLPLSSLHFIHALGVSCRCSGLLANASSLRVRCPAVRRSSTIRAPCRHHRRRGRMVGAVLAVELGTIVFVRSAPASTAPSSSSTSPGKSANFCIPHSRLWMVRTSQPRLLHGFKNLFARRPRAGSGAPFVCCRRQHPPRPHVVEEDMRCANALYRWSFEP
jgi:hypothetical protein